MQSILGLVYHGERLLCNEEPHQMPSLRRILYMKEYTQTISKMARYATAICVIAFSAALSAQAAVIATVTPTLTLNDLGNGTVQANVSGDSYAPVALYYYPQGQSAPQTIGVIGYTGGNQYLSVTLSKGQYNIPIGANVFAVVDGAVSATTQWPATSIYYVYPQTYAVPTYYMPTYPQVYLGQNSISLSLGQTQYIGIYGGDGSSYYISSNSNPSIVSAGISGATLSITASGSGSASIVVCGYGSANTCATLYISAYYPTTTYTYTYPTYTYAYPVQQQAYHPSSLFQRLYAYISPRTWSWHDLSFR